MSSSCLLHPSPTLHEEAGLLRQPPGKHRLRFPAADRPLRRKAETSLDGLTGVLSPLNAPCTLVHQNPPFRILPMGFDRRRCLGRCERLSQSLSGSTSCRILSTTNSLNSSILRYPIHSSFGTPKHTNATLPKSVRLYDTLFLVIADTYCFGWSGESSLPDPFHPITPVPA